jgi:hypothetical protein
MICLLLTAVSCSAGKSIRSEPPPIRPAEEILSSDFFQTGTASWYGDDFHGKLTADGEIYDMNKLTAAHQTLPFHTLLEVENLENGLKVLVRVNDRGPFLKDRVIDLSRLAAQRLGMVEKGTAPVILRLVRWQGNGLPEGGSEGGLPAGRFTAAPIDGECCVQAGAFALRENAEDLLVTLGEIFTDLRFRIVVEDGMFKVLSTALLAAGRCQSIIDRMAEYHLPAFARKPCLGKGE